MQKSGVNMKAVLPRCKWCGDDPTLTDYHDKEWGKPIKDDDKLFERMTLEVFQAGLSWRIVLVKRDAFRKAFSGFEIAKVARYGEKQIDRLMNDSGIIRNQRKILATIYNAKAILKIQKEYGSFFKFIKQIDTENDTVKEMKKHFKFMGKETVSCFLMGCGRIAVPHDKQCYLNRNRI
jgi:DNA-3-methyladenine glycosylase I